MSGGLRALAERDLGCILEDSSTGFGWPIIIIDPAGTTRELVGFSDDIAQVIDPDTGQAVSGRLASVALRTSTLLSLGLEFPRGIAESNSKPWVVQFKDINGLPHVFKVSQSNPDRAIGLVTCLLEIYDLTGADMYDPLEQNQALIALIDSRIQATRIHADASDDGVYIDSDNNIRVDTPADISSFTQSLDIGID